MNQELPRWEDSVPCEAYKPLYPPEGGPLAGFQCCECPREKRMVTRTRRGMLIHLAVCHGVTLQKEFTFEGKVCQSVPAEKETRDSQNRSPDVGKTHNGSASTKQSG